MYSLTYIEEYVSNQFRQILIPIVIQSTHPPRVDRKYFYIPNYNSNTANSVLLLILLLYLINRIINFMATWQDLWENVVSPWKNLNERKKNGKINKIIFFSFILSASFLFFIYDFLRGYNLRSLDSSNCFGNGNNLWAESILNFWLNLLVDQNCLYYFLESANAANILICKIRSTCESRQS